MNSIKEKLISCIFVMIFLSAALQGAQEIIINEFCWQGSTEYGAGDEWIELKNVTAAGIDVTGWKLTVETTSSDPSVYKVIPLPAVTIPAGGFMLLSANGVIEPGPAADTAIAAFDGVSDVKPIAGFGLSNTFCHLVLGDDNDNTIDEAGDRSTLIYLSDSSNKKSMERNVDFGDGTLQSSWHLCRKRSNINGTYAGTPGRENSARYGSIIINEIMWNGSPYIELYSQMVSDFDLNGWKIVGSTSGNIQTFGAGSTIVKNSYFLIKKDNTSTTIAADVTNPVMSISAAGEQLELQNVAGITVDIVNHSGGGWYSGNSYDGGMAMERNSFSSDGQLSASWHCAMGSNGNRYGTPKTVNSTTSSMDISVNEIYWAGTTKEYIELYNNRIYPISLHNWHLWNNSDSAEIPCDFQPDDIIPGGGYFVVKDALVVVTCAEKNPALDLMPSGEHIIIRDFSNNVIDSVRNSGIGWFAGTSTSNSMERNDSKFSGNASYNWKTCRVSNSANSIFGTPGNDNSIDGTGKASISPSGPVDAGSEATFTITFTSEAVLTGGDVTVQIPAGWSAPTTTAANKGYVQVFAVADVNHGTPVVNTTTAVDRTVTINFTSFLPNQSIRIVYGSVNKAVVQKYSGSATFNISTREPSGVLTGIASSPSVQVNSSTGSGPTLIINEVAFDGGGGGFDKDWVEIYCPDDGNNGNGANIEGYYMDDLDSSVDKTFGMLVIKSGEYLIVHCGDAVSTDETEKSGDAIDVYTAYAGWSATDQQVVIYSNTAAVLDAVAWASNEPLGASEAADVTVLVGLNHWTNNYNLPGVSERIDCVDSAVIGSGHSIIRDKNSTDSNDKQDWTKTTIPTPGKNNASGPSGNAKFLVNEVAMVNTAGDWVEIYCVDDANFGNGTEVSGYYFKDDSTFKTLAEGTKVRTGEFILLTFNSDSEDEKTATDGTLRIYTTKSGLTGTDEQVVFSNHLGTVLDAVCWSDYNGTIAASELADIQSLVSSHEWLTSAAESTCVDIGMVIDGGSIYRTRSKQDTDLKSDWFISVKPTPGTCNADAGEAVKIEFENTAREYHPINMEKELTLELLDPFGALAVNSVVTGRIYSNSHSVKFSRDSGINWNQDVQLTFMRGTAKVRIKSSAVENVTLTVISDSASVQDAIKEIIFIREPPVVITEIMYNPGEVDDSDGEWVELYNRSAEVVELKNWKIITGSSTTTIGEGVKINPGEYLVVASELEDGTDLDTDSFATLYGDKDGVWNAALDGYQAIDGAISMTDDSSVTLQSPEGHLITFVYEDELGGDGNNQTLEKKDFDIIDRGELDIDRYNWSQSSFQWGTPGKVNSNVPAGLPTNMIVNHTPVTLVPIGKPVYIVAEVKSAQAVVSSKMYYRHESETSYRVQDMVKIEGTNLYQGIIQDEFLDSESILYYLELKDTDETVLSPTAGSGSPNRISTVDMMPKMKIVPDYKGITQGEIFDVEIRLENAIDLVGATFEMTYDANAFTIVDQNENRLGNQLKVGSFMSAGFAEVNQVNNGLVQFSISGLDTAVNGSGAIAVAKFKIKDAVVQKYEFKFLTALVTDKNGDDTVPAMFNGQIEYGTVSSDLVGPKGAVISGPDEMKLSIPEKALKSVQRIGISKLVSGDSSLPSFAEVLMNKNDIVSVGIAYWIQPDSLTFYRACELVFPFSSDNLEAVGLTTDDEQYLTLYRYKRESGEWEKAGGKVDRSANTVTLQMMQGGIYLLVKDPTKSESFFIKALYAATNPFSPNGNGVNDTTDIRFDLSDEAEVTLRVYNTRGKLVRMLAQEEDYSAGLIGIEWDGRDDDGNLLKTGIYVVHLFAKDNYGRKAKHGKTVVISNHMFE